MTTALHAIAYLPAAIVAVVVGAYLWQLARLLWACGDDCERHSDRDAGIGT